MKLTEAKKKLILENVIEFIEENLSDFKKEKGTLAVNCAVAAGKGFEIQITMTKEDWDFCDSESAVRI